MKPSMSVDKLTPTDPRVTHEYATLNGQRYHYLLGTPATTPRATIFLVHGWPDFSFGWRYQVPYLLSLGLRVVVPDMMGYGLTDAPEPLSCYTFKRASDDLALLAAHLSAPRIILLGHDWGGMVVFRMAQWHPALITAVLSICTAYQRPSSTFVTIESMVATSLPNFAYQIQLASGVVEQRLHTQPQLRQFCNALFGGGGGSGMSAPDAGSAAPSGPRATGFTAEQGVLFDNLPGLARTPLLSEAELDFYGASYSRTGLRGPLNWYRTRALNFEEEKPLAAEAAKGFKFKMPTLFVRATRDVTLPPRMAKGMEKSFERLESREVDAGHWALVQCPGECNGHIGAFLEGVLAEAVKGGSKL